MDGVEATVGEASILTQTNVFLPKEPLTAEVASGSGWAQLAHRAQASAVTTGEPAGLVPAHPPASPTPALPVRADWSRRNEPSSPPPTAIADSLLLSKA